MNSEIKRQCTGCKGEGTIPVIGYRDANVGKTELDKPIKASLAQRWKRFATKHDTGLVRAKVGVIILSCIGLVAYGLGCGFYKAQQHDNYLLDISDRNSYRGGVIFVEYSNGTPVKCFVEREGTYTTNNPSRTIKVYSRYDDDYIAEMAKILDWDESKQKCVRFHYEQDDKWRNFKS